MLVRPLAGTPLMSRSPASTFNTRSLKMTRRLVRFVTVSPASGVCVATVGAITFVGGMVTTTTTGGDVPRAPWSSMAITVRTLVPNGAGHTAE